MKHKYRVAQRVYASTYTNIAEKFKIYLYSLTSDKIDEIQRDFWANGKGLLSVWDTESALELFDSFFMFYYINDGLSYADGHVLFPAGETPPGIVGEKLNLKELFAKFFQTKSNGPVSSPFLAALLLFFAQEKKP